MIQTLEDQMAVKNIEETLESLVTDITETYRAAKIPTSEEEVRELISLVNENVIAEIDLMKKVVL